MPQEGGDLALVECDGEAVDGGTRAALVHLDQVLDLHPPHKTHRLGLKEQLACSVTGNTMGDDIFILARIYSLSRY